MRPIKRLEDAYRFPGHMPESVVKGVFGDPYVRVIRLRRREKNGLRDLRPSASHFLRPEDALGAGPHLHAPGDMKMPSIHPLTLEKSLFFYSARLIEPT